MNPTPLGVEVVNNDLVRAIVDRRLVEFAYKAGGPLRIVEPHDYGIRNGVESLLGSDCRRE
jgi:hypothetical protein